MLTSRKKKSKLVTDYPTRNATREQMHQKEPSLDLQTKRYISC